MRLLLRAVIALLALSLALQSAAQTPDERTSTPLLFSQAIKSYPTCGLWHSSGICFFLVCVGPICTIKTSPRYSHMRPDVVVSTYHDDVNHPWPEVGIPYVIAARRAASMVYAALMGADSAGTRTEKTRDTKQVRFRDADAIGHPAATTDFGSEMMCKSGVQPFQEYFSSFTDGYAWRNFVPVDLLYPGSWLPGVNEVGTTVANTWGNVYPRTGWLNQHHDVKLAAVLSQRVADILTHGLSGHVAQPLPTGGMAQREGQTVFDPIPAIESQMLGGLWQIAVPLSAATPTCHVFGAETSTLEYGDYATTRSESYAYTLWRPYACCKTKGAFLISIIWGMW